MTPTLQAGCVIALLGAESTGKTELGRALTQRLQQRGIPAILVPEYLREWCDLEGRVPQPGEQGGIAAEQVRRIAAAAAIGVAVADTTALMTAIYSDMLFGDRSLYRPALVAQQGYIATLVMALDLPWVADGLQRDGPHVREPVDTLVRAALARGNLAYSVVHGSGAERLSNAWNAINSIASYEGTTGAAGRLDTNRKWTWPCDKCSDPACEHRLFTDVPAERRTEGS